MWRGWRAGTLTVICALFGMIGCGGETISGVRLAPPGESPELTAVDAAALTALSKQWGLMASGIRTAIERQEVRYRAAPSDRYLNQMSVVQAMLERVSADSATSVNAERVLRSRRNSGASFVLGDGESGVAYAGVINPELSITQFQLPVNPELYVTTGVTVPAHYILNRTSGSYVKLGQTYSILSTRWRVAQFRGPFVS